MTKAMLDFTNTEIAFRIKTNAELRNAHFLFKSISSKRLVGILGKLAVIALKFRIPVGWIVKPTLYAQFVGGESLIRSNGVAEKLWKFGIRSILDYSVEGKKDEASIEACFYEIMRSVEFGGTHPYVAFAVFKPTAIVRADILEKVSSGLVLSEVDGELFQQFVERVNALCAKASEVGISMLIDAEDFCYQPAIDGVVEQMMARYNTQKAVVYNTFQLYRTDRLDYLTQQYKHAAKRGYLLGAKLVRGAYMERERERAANLGYPSPVNPTKEVTDTMFNNAILFALENIDRISIFVGTHNEESVRLLVEQIGKRSLPANDSRIWFSQLYGMSDNLSFNLASEGFNVAKYLPYGPVKEVLPYLLRRARENTSVGRHTSRELSLVNQEIMRRKNMKQW